jgi:hypothetical protein
MPPLGWRRRPGSVSDRSTNTSPIKPRSSFDCRATNGIRLPSCCAPSWRITGNRRRKRLRALVHAFIRSECEEARMRMALNDAAPLYRHVPEAREAKAAIERTFQVFMREALPKAADSARALASYFIKTTLSAAGQSFSEKSRTPAEIKACADVLADMFCAYLTEIARKRRPYSSQ